MKFRATVQSFVMLAWLGVVSDSFADEVRCPNIPEGELNEDFDVRDGRSTLRITLPEKYSKAKFYELKVRYGDAEEFMIRAQVVKVEGNRLLAIIHMPDPHPRLSLTAIYHQRDCYQLLEVSYVGNVRAR